MLGRGGDFFRVAQVIAERAAEHLAVPVAILDEHEVVIASDRLSRVGRSLALDDFGLPRPPARLPIHLDGQAVEVVVGQRQGEATVAPRLVRAIVDLVVSQATVLDRLPNQHELKDRFVFGLLRGPCHDEVETLREAEVLGMDLSRPRAVILIDATDYLVASTAAVERQPREMVVQRNHLRARHVIASVVRFFQLPTDTICAYMGGGEIAVLKASSTQDLAAWASGEDTADHGYAVWGANLAALKRAGAALLASLRRDTGASISLGIGRYHPGVQQLSRSYQDARAALFLGRRLLGHDQVHCVDSLGMAAFVGIPDEDIKLDLAAHLLSPLDQEPELLHTLDVFFSENCSLSSTAGRLFIHRNTLSYRLDKITTLTGLEPRRFDDAVQIRLALMLRSLGDGAGSLGTCPIDEPLSAPSSGQWPDDAGWVYRSA